MKNETSKSPWLPPATLAAFIGVELQTFHNLYRRLAPPIGVRKEGTKILIHAPLFWAAVVAEKARKRGIAEPSKSGREYLWLAVLRVVEEEGEAGVQTLRQSLSDLLEGNTNEK